MIGKFQIFLARTTWRTGRGGLVKAHRIAPADEFRLAPPPAAPHAIDSARGCLIASLIVAAAICVAAVAAFGGELPPVPAQVSACFAPEEDCSGFITDAIDRARHQILVNAYVLTSKPIVAALVAAKNRGVDTEAIVDRGAPGERGSGISALAEARIPIWVDEQVYLAHAKVLIIDGASVIAGSYNFSGAAAHNSEDVMLLASPAVAEAFAALVRQAGALRAAGDAAMTVPGAI